MELSTLLQCPYFADRSKKRSLERLWCMDNHKDSSKEDKRLLHQDAAYVAWNSLETKTNKL